MAAAETRAALVARARGAYRAAFGGEPAWGAVAPGRVNLIGDHTDYTGGLALPMAIDRWCAAVGGPAGSARECGTASADVDGGGAWVNYVRGVVSEYEADGVRVPRMHIAVASSVPVGSGLSSSAALEVAVAGVVERAAGGAGAPTGEGRVAMALRCQRAEHRWAGVKCGLMDQMCAVFGRDGCALLMDFAARSVDPVRLPEGLAIVVANSGVRHELAGGEYGARVAACERARVAMGIASLREADGELVERCAGRLSDEEVRSARHVAGENARVGAAAAALRGGDLESLGGLMRESHASLRDGYRVSCPELDVLVELACGVPGVFGARMTGGGFGGCIVAALRPSAAPALAERLEREYPRRCGLACEVFGVRASGGASAVSLDGCPA